MVSCVIAVLLLLLCRAEARTNWCYLEKNSGYNRTSKTAHYLALNGTNPTVAIFPGGPTYYLSFDSSGKINGGFLYHVLESIASLGQFKWNYTVIPAQGSLTDDVFGLNVTSKYDTLAKVYIDTMMRRQLGFGFTPALLDASLAFVTNTDAINQGSATVDYFNWLKPFSYDLWGGIIAVIFLHGFFQAFLAYLFNIRQQSRADSEVPETPSKRDCNWSCFRTFYYTMFNLCYRSAQTLLQVGYLEPKGALGKSLNGIFGLFMLIIVASYTASLASFLISSNVVLNPIQSISDTNRLGATVCFRKGGASIALTTQLYPNINVLQTTTSSNTEVLNYLNSFKCDAGIMDLKDWQVMSVSAANAGCKNVLTGPLIRQESASLIYQDDYTQQCTGFFGDVLSSLITILNDRYVIGQLWLDTLDAYTASDCDAGAAGGSSTGTSTASLQMRDFYGLFVFWTFASAIVLFFTLSYHTLEATGIRCCTDRESDTVVEEMRRDTGFEPLEIK
jgi:Ligand-gated ion channel